MSGTRRMGASVVAGVAAYASYVHQREFALQGGVDRTSATLWPLSVDGLLLPATAGVPKPSHGRDRRTCPWCGRPFCSCSRFPSRWNCSRAASAPRFGRVVAQGVAHRSGTLKAVGGCGTCEALRQWPRLSTRSSPPGRRFWANENGREPAGTVCRRRRF
ncbi:MAG: DUF2637 domain-containing protein [Streptomyces sp.]|nr:DUF2637 domain-containing protein [Streptomyces sp.]